jgi:hypothetical protein
MKLALSESRDVVRFATSCAVPGRPSGCFAAVYAELPGDEPAGGVELEVELRVTAAEAFSPRQAIRSNGTIGPMTPLSVALD